jgi:hypothetical protein
MAKILNQISSLLSGTQSNEAHYTLYNQFNSRTEVERTTHFQKQFDYYIGDTEQIRKHLIVALQKTFSQDDINEFQLPMILIVKRVIDKLSMAYLENAERYMQVDKEDVTDEQGNTVSKTNEAQKKQALLFSEIIGNTNINQKIKLCYHLAKLSDVCHIQPVWRNNRVEYDVIPSHLITVAEKQDDYLSPKAILTRILRPSEDGTDELQYIYMDEKIVAILDDKGKKIQEEPNPYGMLTALPMRIRETENYFGEGDSSLIDLNEKINVALVNAFDNMVMQSHGQAFAVNLGMKGTLKTGPRHVIEAENVSSDQQTPSFQFVQPQPSTKEAMEFIDWMIKEACIQRGLPPFSVSTENKAESGAAKAIDSRELFEIRQDDVEALKEFEHKLYEITRAVWNYHNPGKKLDEKMRFAVEFEDQEVEPSENEKLDANRKKLAMGLWTPVEEFVDEDNGVDEEMALNIVKKNLAIRNELNDEFGIMQALDKALQTDTNQGQAQ